MMQIATAIFIKIWWKQKNLKFENYQILFTALLIRCKKQYSMSRVTKKVHGFFLWSILLIKQDLSYAK